ncbi:MAG: tetratricopeptide repeat protein [Phycisphaerae bacterium]|nr:tetratricopeptide repeat protein [Phycisphaerae bacterium]
MYQISRAVHTCLRLWHGRLARESTAETAVPQVHPTVKCFIRLTLFASIVWAILGLSSVGAGAPASGSKRPDLSQDADVQAYYSGNGLLNRGLYDLAAAEYRKFLASHEDHEKAPAARYGLAVCLFRLGRLDEAAEELTRLRGVPDFAYAAEVATMLGQCHLAGHRYGEAAEAFEAVLQEAANHALADDAAAQLVEALYEHGQTDEAVTRCEMFASRWPDSPHRDRADYFGGLAEMGRQAYTAAAARFADLLGKHANSPFAAHAALLLAQCYHHTDDSAAAARQYEQVLNQTDSPYRADALLGLATILQQDDRHKEAGKLLDQLLEKHADSPLAEAARLLRGRVWFDLGEYESAARAFQQVGKAEGAMKADAAYWSAKCKLRTGDFAGAARGLKRAIADHPDCRLLPEMCYDRAIALLRGGNPNDAAKALVDYRSRFPNHALAPDALHLLATIAHQGREYEQSQEHVRRFLEQYPDHDLTAKITFLSAENEYLAGNYKDAAAGYRRFLDKHHDDAQAKTARFRLGMVLHRLQQFDEARRLLVEVDAEAGEQFPSRHLALGDIHFQRGEWKQAGQRLATYLAKGLEVAAADDALLKLGLASLRQGKHAEAIRQFDRLLERFDKSPHRLQAMFERGQALVGLERFDEAVEAFEAVVARGGETRFATPARRHLAAISLRRGDFTGAAKRFAKVAQASADSEDEAEALFQQGRALMAAQEFKAAEEAFDRLIDRFPSHARVNAARANLVVALARQDRHEAALELAGQVSPSDLDPTLGASLQYERAWCLRRTGKDEEAAKAYRELIRSHPGSNLHAHALLELADIEANGDHHAEAIKHLERLREMVEQSGEGLPPSLEEQMAYRLGTCHFHVRQFTEAAEVLGEFVKRHSGSQLIVSASFFCGEALFELGRHKAAIKHFERVVAGPTSDPAFGAALLRLGECRGVLQHWVKSEELFTKYLEQFGGSEHWFQAEFGIGWARENQGRYDEAIEAYERVIERHKGPTAARAQFQIGQCLFARKRYEDAARELLKVDILYAYPEWSAAALYEAGRCFEKLSRSAEARRQFTTVVENHKGTQWAQLASERLAALAKQSLPGR